MRRRCVVSALGGAVLVIGISAQALANSDGYSFKYYGEWMTSWSGCTCVPTAQGLSYPDDQINAFAAVMDANQHQRVAVYGNHDVWAADIVEDGLGGADNVEADSADIYAFAGHGTVANDSNGQTYKSPRCTAGYSYDDCWLVFYEPLPGTMGKTLVEIEPATDDPSVLALIAADAKAETARKAALMANADQRAH